MDDPTTAHAAKTKVESMLGRRLRPWWGTAPWTLAIRAIVGGVVMGVIVYACLEVRSGGLDLTGSGLEDRQDTIESVALVVGILAAIGVVYRVVQLVVAVLDLVPRQHTVGVLVDARRRRTGDFLPAIVQTLWYRRTHSDGTSREHSRRTRHEVVLETPDGLSSWTVRPRFLHQAQRGRTVRLTASRLLGHVTSIEEVPASEGAA